jgi:hypothetical protein
MGSTHSKIASRSRDDFVVTTPAGNLKKLSVSWGRLVSPAPRSYLAT